MARGELATWSANSGEVPPRLRWGKTANTPLPRHDRLDGEVEMVKGITTKL